MQRFFSPIASAAAQGRGPFWAGIGLNGTGTIAAKHIRLRSFFIKASPPLIGGGLLFGTWLLSAQPTDPVTDRMRYELAAAQRDYLAAKQAYDQAAGALRMKLEQLNAVCAGQGALFDANAFNCKKAEVKK